MSHALIFRGFHRPGAPQDPSPEGPRGRASRSGCAEWKRLPNFEPRGSAEGAKPFRVRASKPSGGCRPAAQASERPAEGSQPASCPAAQPSRLSTPAHRSESPPSVDQPTIGAPFPPASRPVRRPAGPQARQPAGPPLHRQAMHARAFMYRFYYHFDHLYV